VTISQEDLLTFIGEIYEIRNVFSLSAVEEPLEVSCQIIGA